MPYDFQLRTRLIAGPGSLQQLGPVAKEMRFRRTLLVADRGLLQAGHVQKACAILEAAGISVFPYDDFEANPDSAMIESGRAFAAPLAVDSFVGLGGGSSMDCAKGINFLITNGGKMEDYQGYRKARHGLLPMIAIPTTAGTGSEAQSYAVISLAGSHKKMACGDPTAAFRAAILDPELTVSQPFSVRAAASYDAISHAVESLVTTRRNPVSECFSRQAWRLLQTNFEASLARPGNLEIQGAMQLGAFLAGLAIENSMLGATHACANPITAAYGTAHGVAIAALLPHVVRWNESAAGALYRSLDEQLAARLDELAKAGNLANSLQDLGVEKDKLSALTQDAAEQFTGRFNPRPLDAAGALEIYQCAF